MTEAPDYLELAELLRRLGYTEMPSNFHGALCGALCVLEPERLGLEALLIDHAEGLAQLSAQDLSRRIARHFGDHIDALGCLEGCNPFARIGDHITCLDRKGPSVWGHGGG